VISFATEHHFTGKERDAESGNDYFGARYYASAMGRFLSPDWSAKVEPVPYSKLGDPQTLNLYAYVGNNPLSRTDPTGHEATVSRSCTAGDNGRTSCTVNISASFSIYATNGSGISKDQLNAAATSMKSSIEGAWSGSFSQGSVDYTVSTHVTVSVASSEDAAKSSGAQNVVEMTNGPQHLTAAGLFTGGYTNPKASAGQRFDSGIMDINNVDNYAKHEFTHFLGVNDKPGAVLSNTNPGERPARATGQDLRMGVSPVTFYPPSPLGLPGPFDYQTYGAPAPGQDWR
jgi:RHS repeat-associated protein